MPPAPTLPSVTLEGYVVGCSDYSAAAGCLGFWWYASGGPDPVYYLATGQAVPGYVYIDDSTPCGPGEPYPMDTFSAPQGSVACEQDWVNYERGRDAAVIYAAVAGDARIANATSLQEWYPAYGRASTVACGAQGYIVQRYFNGTNASGPEYGGFDRLWDSAAACGTEVLAWY